MRFEGQQLFVAWAPFQRRVESISRILGIRILYVPRRFEAAILLPISYAIQAAATLRELLATRPCVVWVQAPPTFLPHFLLFVRWVTRGRFKIVVDCHNAVFRAPWVGVPFLSAALGRCEVSLAHNEEVAASARISGLEGARFDVLEDPPALLQMSGVQSVSKDPSVIVPCSFRADEPILELLEAASLLPEVTFFVTGRASRARAAGYCEGAPSNVVFTDFLSEAVFNDLLCSAHVVLGLTTVEGIQLSVANEGVGAGKAIVLSNTRILRDMFGSAALFTENSPTEIAAAITMAATIRVELELRSVELRERRLLRWRDQAAPIVSSLG